jgi:hypothetical protein
MQFARRRCVIKLSQHSRGPHERRNINLQKHMQRLHPRRRFLNQAKPESESGHGAPPQDTADWRELHDAA